MIELHGGQRAVLRPLFSGYRPLHGAVHAVLSGEFGRAWADDATAPRVGMLELEFYFVAGDAASAAAEDALRRLPRGVTVAPDSDDWAVLIRRVRGDGLVERTRFGLDAGAWDRGRLAHQTAALPPDFTLKRIGADDVERFAGLEHALIAHYRAPADFVEHGVGFGVEYDGRFVSGCASYCLADRKLEFEIQTHPDFRRRGLALAAGAAMVMYCLGNGIAPCWDAHNEGSALLAEKLGFVARRPYTVYELG